MVYTGTLMTENAFYPLFLVFASLLVLRSSGRRLRASSRCSRCAGSRSLTRAQAIALVPAILDRAAAARPARAALRAVARARSTGSSAARRARARSRRRAGPLAAGRCSAPTARRRTRTTRSRASCAGSLYHLAELDLYLGVLPFAALLALWLRRARRRPRVRGGVAAGLRLADRRGRRVRVDPVSADRGAQHVLRRAVRF